VQASCMNMKIYCASKINGRGLRISALLEERYVMEEEDIEKLEKEMNKKMEEHMKKRISELEKELQKRQADEQMAT